MFESSNAGLEESDVGKEAQPTAEALDSPPAANKAPRPFITLVRKYCIRLKGAECTRCAQACPHDAIDFGEDRAPIVDPDLCTSCGICFGICDGFSSTRVTLLDLVKRVESIAERGDSVYFTCVENVWSDLNLASNVVVLPCLAAVPPEFWTLILAEGIRAVAAFDLHYCSDCTRAGEIAETLYTHSMKSAERYTREKIRYSEVLPEKEDLLRDISNPDGVDRRGAFDNFVTDISDIASGKRRLRNSEVLHQFIERRERSKALTQATLSEKSQLDDVAPLGEVKKTLMPRRKMLLEAIEVKPRIAPRIPFFTVEVVDETLDYRESAYPSCPTGALHPHPETGKAQIDEAYCVACGICLGLYPEASLELIETTAERLVLRKAEE